MLTAQLLQAGIWEGNLPKPSINIPPSRLCNDQHPPKIRSKMPVILKIVSYWCLGRDSNSQDHYSHEFLRLARIPFRHPGSMIIISHNDMISETFKDSPCRVSPCRVMDVYGEVSRIGR